MATKKPESRDTVLVRAAKLRAKIISLVKKTPGITTTDLTVQMQDFLKEVGGNDLAVRTQLIHLHKNEQLAQVKEGAQLHYYLPTELPRAPRAKKEKTVNSPPNFTVDLVKSTGRVRLNIGGFVIDIGVAE